MLGHPVSLLVLGGDEATDDVSELELLIDEWSNEVGIEQIFEVVTSFSAKCDDLGRSMIDVKM